MSPLYIMINQKILLGRRLDFASSFTRSRLDNSTPIPRRNRSNDAQ